jgi:hypothetical protein
LTIFAFAKIDWLLSTETDDFSSKSWVPLSFDGEESVSVSLITTVGVISAFLIVIFEMLHSVLATYLVSPLLARDTMTEMNRAVPMKTDGMTEMTEVREA